MASLINNNLREMSYGGGSTSVTREYCLRWNNHQPNLVQYFGSLLNQEAFVDVTLVSSEGRKIACHKTILSSCSPYFQRVFEGNPCKHPIVILKDVEFADLQTIISFIYHGEVNISQERLNGILLTASSLQVKGLAEVPAEDLKEKVSCNRKRDRDIERQDSDRSVLREPVNNLSPSNSWTANDDVEELANMSDIPRKKLKKSASATTASASASTSTNDGDQSGCGSFESGVGASVSRSIDDSSHSGSAESRVETLIRSNSGPPPLQPIMHLPGKSKSLDHMHEPNSIDSEHNSGAFGESLTFDDSGPGQNRADRGVDLSGVKIETVSDGEIEIEDDKGSGRNPETNEFKKLIHSVVPSSSSSLFSSTVHHFSASGRRGRPLIRQPRIKRPDNDAGGELFISESVQDEGLDPASETEETVTSRAGNETENHVTSKSKSEERNRCDSEDPMMVPIVTVSQSSPTPPCSPLQSKEEEMEDEKISIGTQKITTVIPVGTSCTMNSSNASSPALLMVPKIVESVNNSSRGSTSGSGAHLVKQISQPHLPSHTSVLASSGSNHNPVIRRQHSQPNPATQSLVPRQPPKLSHRLMPMTPLNTSKRGALVHLVPAHDGSRSSFSTSRDDDPGVNVGSTIYALDTKSFIQLMPVSSRDSGNRVMLAHSGSTFSREDRSDSDTFGDLTIITKDDQEAKDAPSSPTSHDVKNQLKVIQRAGHCPALRPGPALGCNFCWNSVDECGRILRRKTKYHCPECRINLCIVPCFQEYHEQSEKKKPRNKLGLPKPSSM